MTTPAGRTRNVVRGEVRQRLAGSDPVGSRHPFLRRMASNFAVLGASEVLCRAISVFVTLALMKRLRADGFGRVEFAFNVVFWLVLIVRDCFETIVTREIARHPRLTRRLVDHVLAAKLMLALLLFIGLSVASLLAFRNPLDRQVLVLYGLLLVSTALGLDFVFRGRESVGLVAVSLLVRTSLYSAGVWLTVTDPSRILLVPTWLAVGEFTGIGLVWVAYARTYGLPRPVLGMRFLGVLARRGRSVGLIHLCQTVIVSADIMVVGLVSPWSEVGWYGAPHRLIAAVMAFGLIFQQVIFPSLARGWRASPGSCRRIMDVAVQALVSGSLPVAVGGTLLAGPLARFLLPGDYQEAGVLLAVGVWRAPVLSLAFLYQSGLIAMNRESQGLRLLACGAIASAPLIAAFRWGFGLVGASSAVLTIGLGLVLAGYVGLKRGACQPSAGHHLGRPVAASLVMAPVTLALARWHVVAAVLGGAVAYLAVLAALGGFRFTLPERATARGPHVIPPR